MATITEDFVSFEIAKLLKEKGFNEPIQYFYKFDSKELYRGTVFTNTQIGDKFYNAPTLQMAMKWLRKVHQIAIVIDCWFGGENYINWHGKIMCYGEELKTQQDVDMPYVATYEKACEEAVLYCLEHLI